MHVWREDVVYVGPIGVGADIHWLKSRRESFEATYVAINVCNLLLHQASTIADNRKIWSLATLSYLTESARSKLRGRFADFNVSRHNMLPETPVKGKEVMERSQTNGTYAFTKMHEASIGGMGYAAHYGIYVVDKLTMS